MMKAKLNMMRVCRAIQADIPHSLPSSSRLARSIGSTSRLMSGSSSICLVSRPWPARSMQNSAAQRRLRLRLIAALHRPGREALFMIRWNVIVAALEGHAAQADALARRMHDAWKASTPATFTTAGAAELQPGSLGSIDTVILVGDR